MSNWQPIETAPKDGSIFIGLVLIATVDGERQWKVEDARWQDGDYRFRSPRAPRPSHWQALNAPSQ